MTSAVIELIDLPIDDPTNQAVAINDALADPGTNTVVLPAGVIWIEQSVVVPASKTLVMQPDTILRALPSFTNVGDTNGGVVLAGNRAFVQGGTIDMNKVGLGDGQDDRKNGVMTLNGCRDTVARDLVVMNCTGYGNYTAGGDSRATPPSKYSENVTTYNCQVHHEPQASDGDVFFKCEAYDGDGDIPCGSYFHPIAGTRNCAFIQCRAVGGGAAGAEITTNVSPMENVSFVNCDVVMNGTASAITIPAVFDQGIVGLTVTGGSYTSAGGQAATLRFLTDAIFTAVTFSGGATAIESTNSDVEFIGCHASATGSSATYGVLGLGTGQVRWNAGSITATGPTASTRASAGNVRVSADTQLVPLPAGTTKRQARGFSPFVANGVACYANISTPWDVTSKVHVRWTVKADLTAAPVSAAVSGATTPSQIPYWFFLSATPAPGSTIRVYFPGTNFAGKGYQLDWEVTETT